ncbi:putative minor structural protein [Bacillus phage vB_BceM_Bc431v3]|uniref:Putative minor structural protein n=1 Tax=Bacillus phage vB_BceM_Bc431v3 TaxID=1195072 RepID=M4HNS1_9CAUD|nr:tail protein [Bacillus phage vB_BceM_Bc431v3]AFQ96521.1 putative minor structural protein [Bacillus phage vB_BceM_Bc431v3]
MASGGFDLSTSNTYVKGRVNWSSTANTNENYSNVYVEMRFSRTNSGYTTYGSGTFGIYVDGQAVENTTSFSITQNSNTLVVSGTVRVNHNADGTKNFRIGASGFTNVFSINEGSTTAYMDNIPRASTISSNVSWTAGVNSLPVTINRASSAFVHYVELQVKNPINGSWAIVASRSNVGDSVTFDFSKDEITKMYQQIVAYEETQAWMKVETWNGGTFVGRNEKYGTVYAAPTGTASYNQWGSFDIGQSITGWVNNYVNGFTYNLTMNFGSFSRTWNNVPKDYTLSFSAAEIQTLYGQTSTANSKTGTITCRTLYNGVYAEDGAPVSNVTTFTLNVKSSDPTYAGGFTYLDTNGTTTTLTGNNQYIVQGKSKLQIKLPAANKATANNGATMSRYDVTVNGVTQSVNYATTDLTVNFNEVNASSNATATVTAVDSRGNKTSASSVILMLPYSPPVISASADRLNNFEDSTTIKLSGSISPLTISSANKNSLTVVKFQRRQVGGTYDSPGTNFTITGNPNFTATDVKVNLANTLAWEILITATDKVGSTVTLTRTVPVGTPIFFIDTVKKTVGVNKFPTSAANGLEIAGDLDVDGIIKAKADQWMGNSKVGLDMRNSDMKGLNALYFNDASDSGDEGINFLRSGKGVGSTNIADYDNFCVYDGAFRLNNRNLFWQEGGQASNNIRLAGDMYSQTTGGVIFDVWGNIKGQPTAVDYNTWSVQDTAGRTRFICGIGRGSTAATEVKSYTGGIKLVHDDIQVAAFWQQGQGASHIFQLGAGILQYYNNWFEFKGPGNSGWGNVYGNWVAPSSAAYKKDIQVFDDSALSYVNSVKPVLYQYLEQDDSEPYTLGLIAEESPVIIQGANGKGVNAYSMITLLWKAMQEIDGKVENINRRITLR